MLGVTDRQPSADLAPAEFGNPLEPTADSSGQPPSSTEGGPVPALPSFESSADVLFVMFPEVQAFGTSQALHAAATVGLVLNCFGWVTMMPFWLTSFTPYQAPSALIYTGCCCGGIASLFVMPTLGSLRVALRPAEAGDGLCALGLNEQVINKASVSSLNKWRIQLWLNGAAPLVLLSIFFFSLPIVFVTQEQYQTLCQNIPTGQIGLHMFFNFSFPLTTFALGPMVAHAWFLTMKVGAALSRPKVSPIKVWRCSPIDPCLLNQAFPGNNYDFAVVTFTKGTASAGFGATWATTHRPSGLERDSGSRRTQLA